LAPESAASPHFVTYLVVSQDVDVAVVSRDLEPALRGREPAIDDDLHLKAMFSQPERARLLSTAIASVGLNTNCHDFGIVSRPLRISGSSPDLAGTRE